MDNPAMILYRIFTLHNPKPALLTVEKKGSKIRPAFSAGIPHPLSIIWMTCIPLEFPLIGKQSPHPAHCAERHCLEDSQSSS
jgi:hypothetical protein